VVKESSGNPTESVLGALRELVAEAKQGNAEVLPELKRLLDRYPEVWRHYGDMAKHVESKWLDMIAGDDAAVRESLERTAAVRKSQCLDVGGSPLERLLVDRINMSRLMVYFFDSALAIAVDAPKTRVRFLQQQLDRAQKRHLEAVKSLAEVRSLLP